MVCECIRFIHVLERAPPSQFDPHLRGSLPQLCIFLNPTLTQLLSCAIGGSTRTKDHRRDQVHGGYLWSPKRNANGNRNAFYEFMPAEVAPGDVIFSFKDTFICAIGTAQSYCWESPKPLEFGNAGQNWENVGWKVTVRGCVLSYSHQDRNAAIRVDACRDSAVRYSLLDCGKPCTGILVASKQVMAVQSGRMSARCGEPATKSLLRLGEAESGLTTYLRRPAVRSWRLPTSCNVLRHSTWRLTFVSLAAEDGRTLSGPAPDGHIAF